MELIRTVVITGANAGIGFATAKLLAGHGYSIVTICRRKIEGDKVVAELKNDFPGIQVENFEADLSDLDSVKRASQEILARHSTIDRLINNAGYYPKEIEYVHDIEKTIYASHLGHMLLTLLLMPALERSSESRVINVSSGLHAIGKVSRMFARSTAHNPPKAYADAKLANILFTMALSKRLPLNITTYSLHPGVVNTNFGINVTGFLKVMILIFKPFFLTPAKGAYTTVYLSTEYIENLKLNNGRIFAKRKVVKSKNADVTNENASWLWDRSREILRHYL